MIFNYNIVTPANTLKAQPKITELPIARGVIVQWFIYVPSGHEGEAHIRFNQGSDPIMPINPDGSVSGESFPFKGPEWKYIKNTPYTLHAVTWNTDTRNSHEFLVWIFMQPLWTFSPFSDQLTDMLEQDDILRLF